jgi:hypothetical protein
MVQEGKRKTMQLLISAKLKVIKFFALEVTEFLCEFIYIRSNIIKY